MTAPDLTDEQWDALEALAVDNTPTTPIEADALDAVLALRPEPAQPEVTNKEITDMAKTRITITATSWQEDEGNIIYSTTVNHEVDGDHQLSPPALLGWAQKVVPDGRD